MVDTRQVLRVKPAGRPPGAAWWPRIQSRRSDRLVGRGRRTGNAVYRVKRYRGFESLSLRFLFYFKGYRLSRHLSVERGKRRIWFLYPNGTPTSPFRVTIRSHRFTSAVTRE